MQHVVSTTRGESKSRFLKLTETVEVKGQQRSVTLVAQIAKTQVQDLVVESSETEFQNGIVRTTKEIVNPYELTEVGIGMSVCSPEDKFDGELGTQIATNRALNPKVSLGIASSRDNTLGVAVAQVLLRRKMDHIRRFPLLYVNFTTEEERAARKAARETKTKGK